MAGRGLVGLQHTVSKCGDGFLGPAGSGACARVWVPFSVNRIAEIPDARASSAVLDVTGHAAIHRMRNRDSVVRSETACAVHAVEHVDTLSIEIKMREEGKGVLSFWAL